MVIYRQGYQIENVSKPFPVFKQIFSTKSIEKFEEFLANIDKENSWDVELD